MDKTTLVNVSLQTLATTSLFGAVAMLMEKDPNYITAASLFVVGIVLYFLYERYPDSPKS